MTEYIRIRNGSDSATMSLHEWERFVDLVRGGACPQGFLPVVKDAGKPTPGPGEELCFTYAKSEDGTFFAKSYFLAPKGTSFAPRKFSKLSIYLAITKLNAWAKVQYWLETKTVDGVNGWVAFQLAQEISDAHPLFAPLAQEAKAILELTDDQFESLLESCILAE